MSSLLRRIPKSLKEAFLTGMALVIVLWLGDVAWAQGDPAIRLPQVGLDYVDEGDAVQMINLSGKRMLLGAKFAFEGVAIFFIVFYGGMMALNFGNEEEIKNHQMGLIYSIVGFLMINYAELIIEVVNPARNNEVIDQADLQTLVFDRIITFLRFGMGSIAVAIIVYKGFKLVTAAGKEEEISKDKAYILWAAIGLMLITLARPIQIAITEGQVALGNEIITTVTRLMYFVIPPIAIFFIIYGAVFMLMSNGDEERYKRGTGIIKGTIIALVIIYSSFTIVSEILKFAL